MYEFALISSPMHGSLMGLGTCIQWAARNAFNIPQDSRLSGPGEKIDFAPLEHHVSTIGQYGEYIQ